MFEYFLQHCMRYWISEEWFIYSAVDFYKFLMQSLKWSSSVWSPPLSSCLVSRCFLFPPAGGFVMVCCLYSYTHSLRSDNTCNVIFKNCRDESQKKTFNIFLLMFLFFFYQHENVSGSSSLDPVVFLDMWKKIGTSLDRTTAVTDFCSANGKYILHMRFSLLDP